jgi:hypothetical protein
MYPLLSHWSRELRNARRTATIARNPLVSRQFDPAPGAVGPDPASTLVIDVFQIFRGQFQKTSVLE